MNLDKMKFKIKFLLGLHDMTKTHNAIVVNNTAMTT